VSKDTAHTPWRIKLDRAHFHVDSLQQLIATVQSTGDLEALTEVSGDRRAVRVVLKRDLPSEIPAMIGDILHNTRSALDCLAFEICKQGAQRSGRSLSEDQERLIQYPICIDSRTFKNATQRRLPLAPEHIVEIIRTTQPFYLAMQGSTPSELEIKERARCDRLWQLAELSNADKHRQLHLAAAVPGEIYAGSSEGLKVEWQWNQSFGRNDDVVGWWILRPNTKDAEFFPHAEACVSLLDHHLSPGPPIEIVGYINGLVRHVEMTIVWPLERALREVEEFES
jgi:hypothetical protein